MPGGGAGRNQRGVTGGGSGQATPPEDRAELGHAVAGCRGCMGGGSGHWT
jgi:hypothetical protein